VQIAFFSAKNYDRRFFDEANADYQHKITYFEPRLTGETASLAHGHTAVCAFVNDVLDAAVLSQLSQLGVRAIALRSAGFNHVDLKRASELALPVVRVPAYSPHAVAEFAVGLILTLNRKIHRAFNRVREGNFTLDGLLGFDLHGRTMGVVGTGQIGEVVARIMHGFGCRLVGFDVRPNPNCVQLGMEYLPIDELMRQSDIISLHCPLTPTTRYLINEQTIATMRNGVMLINTSRGAVVNTRAVIAGLKSGKIGALGLDVYEEEVDYFFEDHSAEAIEDDVLARLLTFPNVIVSSHQAFFTREALSAIAHTTLQNLSDIESRGQCPNQVLP
jgi:D-lactate dehydrogenase